MTTRRVLSVVAALSAAAGLVSAVSAAAALRDYSEKLRAAESRAARVRELEKAADSSRAAIHMLESLPDAHPKPIADLLKKTMSGQKYEITEQSSQPTIAGWTVRRMDVNLPDIQLAGVGEFIAIAESQRPPWRLVSCRIRASVPQGGKGQASLSFEALDRTSEPESPPAPAKTVPAPTGGGLPTAEAAGGG